MKRNHRQEGFPGRCATTEMIDFRSDTKTFPTREMLEAMRRAELGDSKSGEDPTVLKLQEMAAQRLGKEDALLLISGTMGNLVAHMTLAATGEAILPDRHCHAYHYEGGAFVLAGRIPLLMESTAGRLRYVATPRGSDHR